MGKGRAAKLSADVREDADERRLKLKGAAKQQSLEALDDPGLSAALNVQAPLGAQQALRLQRLAGNRATSQVLAVQRSIDTRSSELTGLTTGGAPGTSLIGPKGRIAATFRNSTFGSVHDALVRYEKAAKPEAKLKYLQEVDRQATKWINEHAADDGAIDRRRRAVLVKLVDELPGEMARLSTQLAHGIYVDNVKNAFEEPKRGSKDPGKKYALKGVSTDSKAAALQTPAAGKQFADSSGLSEAEMIAVRMFTVDDYKYINPATKNDATWMKGNMDKKGIAFNRGAAADVMFEEGQLHSGVINQALKKLPPDPSLVYRGATYTDGEYADEIGIGKVFTFPSFASASKARGTAEDFAKKNGKDHAVIFRIQNSGGRDISKLSYFANEEEVTLMAGSKYSVQSIKQIPPLKPGDTRSWHEVVLAP